MPLTPRSTHRDLAYFFLGLIIAFSISGIFLNHRQSWHPRRYTYASREINVPLPVTKEQVTDSFVTAFTATHQIEDQVRRFSVDDKNIMHISYTMNDVTVDLNTGSGKIETYRLFMNKIWNASRFALMNLEDGVPLSELSADSPLALHDRRVPPQLRSVGEVARRHARRAG